MRKVPILVCFFLSALLAATVFFWIHSRHMPEAITLTWDVRSVSTPSASTYFGTQSFGFYSYQGRMGFLSHAEGTTGYDAEDIIADPTLAPRVVPTHPLWDQSDAPDGASPALIEDFPQWTHFGVTAYDGDDAGMSHQTHISAHMINDWEVATVLSLALLPAVWKLRQPHLRRSKGHCQKCNYDLRAHQSGGIAARCPECGTAIGSA